MRPPKGLLAATMLAAAVLVCADARAEGAIPVSYPYVSPVPGAQMVSPWNNIVLRAKQAVDAATLSTGLLTVVGSRSGAHAGELVLSDDGETVVFNPAQPFALGETVHVQLEAGLAAMSGQSLPPLAFDFTVSSVDPKTRPSHGVREWVDQWGAATESRGGLDTRLGRSPNSVLLCDTLPPPYPPVTLLRASDPEPGAVFIAPVVFSQTPGGHLLILDNLGNPLFYRALPGFAFDFKMQPNGLLTYFMPPQFLVMDSTYTVIDTITTGNGYASDLHDLQVLPNGHMLLMSYDTEPVGMDTVVVGGRPDAQVTGLIVQELDAAKNVVFQWRSWDHFEITDVASPDVSLTDSLIDYVHGNAVELDQDGHLLLSSRHMNEITKINRQTGNVIWRMGLGAVNNQFTFTNDTRGFSHQHDIRRLPNGNITIFDNGNFLDPQYSRALEYSINEITREATLVWLYRGNPDIDGRFMGNVQRRASGGTMIGWGGERLGPKATDLHADGTVSYEIGMDENTFTYRAFRFPWRSAVLFSDVETLDFGGVHVTESASMPVTITNGTSAIRTITCIAVTNSVFSVSTPVPQTLGPGEELVVDVGFHPLVPGPNAGILYVRAVEDTELVAVDVALTGQGVPVLDVAGRSPGYRLYPSLPNPFRGVATIRFDLPVAGAAKLEVFDVRGRKVANLVDGVVAAGAHEVRWSPVGQTSGLYFYRLVTKEFEATRKLAFMR